MRLQKEALSEMTDAWLWYEALREGLGDEFILKVYESFKQNFS